MQRLLDIACIAAKEAVELLRTHFTTDAGIQSFQGKDIKTLADVEAQHRILGILASTGIEVIAEEGEHSEIKNKSLYWLIDPLDGTLNFTRHFPMAAVSIALWENDQPVLGVIHDIFHNTVFSGIVNEGAWINGIRMNVSETTDYSQAIVATGFPSGRSYETNSLLEFVHSVQKYKKVRMLGSAALMLAQVAAGRFDAYNEDDIFIWDVAAGLALIKAAGGDYTMEKGSGPYKYKVHATNGKL